MSFISRVLVCVDCGYVVDVWHGTKVMRTARRSLHEKFLQFPRRRLVSVCRIRRWRKLFDCQFGWIFVTLWIFVIYWILEFYFTFRILFQLFNSRNIFKKYFSPFSQQESPTAHSCRQEMRSCQLEWKANWECAEWYEWCLMQTNTQRAPIREPSTWRQPTEQRVFCQFPGVHWMWTEMNFQLIDNILPWVGVKTSRLECEDGMVGFGGWQFIIVYSARLPAQSLENVFNWREKLKYREWMCSDKKATTRLLCCNDSAEIKWRGNGKERKFVMSVIVECWMVVLLHWEWRLWEMVRGGSRVLKPGHQF
jgi:hypothetical protein